jgi:hypothetical protein
MKRFNTYISEEDAVKTGTSPSNKYFDEYFLDAFDHKEHSIKLKTVGTGQHAPIKVYIDDNPWEMFKGENKARKSVTDFIDSGEYEKTVERAVQQQQLATQAQEQPPTPAEQKSKEKNEDVVNEFARFSAINADILTDIRAASQRRQSSLIKLENGDVVKIQPEEAKVLMMVHDELNTRNRHTFEKLLQSKKTYMKLLYFVTNELV